MMFRKQIDASKMSITKNLSDFCTSNLQCSCLARPKGIDFFFQQSEGIVKFNVAMQCHI